MAAPGSCSAPSLMSINCLEEVVREDRYLAGNRFRFADAFFSTPGHHRTDSFRPQGEQRTEMHLRFGRDVPGDLLFEQGAELRGERVCVGVEEESVDVVRVLVDKPMWRTCGAFGHLVAVGDQERC